MVAEHDLLSSAAFPYLLADDCGVSGVRFHMKNASRG